MAALTTGRASNSAFKVFNESRLLGVIRQLSLFPENPRVVRFVEAAACQLKSLLHSDVDLPRDIIVPGLLVPPDPQLPDLYTVDSHYSYRVIAAF